MKQITATELSRQLRRYLNQVEHQGTHFSIARNKQCIAQLIPGSAQQTALEALGDIYNILPTAAATGWGVRTGEPLLDASTDTQRDPWDL